MTYDIKSFMAGLRTGLALPRVAKKKPGHYLTFESEDSSEFTLSVKNRRQYWNGTLYYSIDAETWSEWDGTTVLNSVNGAIFLRGVGNRRISGNYAYPTRWELTSGKRIKCIGNIETLLDWESVAAGLHPQMYPECFYSMFTGCDSLVKAPALPATALSTYCYAQMFNGCTSLIKAPDLPATTLEDHCYDHMFHGCTALTSVPSLPATMTAQSCYYAMFASCTSLERLPELPATVLRTSCYTVMFDSCSLIRVSTEQTATYQYPFRIPTSGTGTADSSSKTFMFRGTGGPFTDTPSINTTYYTDHPPVPAA